MFLTKDEIVQLTGRHRKTCQKQVLEAIGIEYRENGINDLVISRRHVERVLGGEPSEPEHSGQAEPNFAAVGG
jgi:hypothetical protein